MEFLTKSHPCIVAGVLVVVSVIIRAIGIATDATPVALTGDAVFVLALVLGVVAIILRRRARRKALGFCHQCGAPYMSETEKEEHELSHRYGG